MKSTAILIALMSSSAVTALEPRLFKPITGSSEVVVTRTVTVTTFQGAAQTHANFSMNQALHRTKSDGRKGPASIRPVASPLEHLPSSHGVAKEVPEPSNQPIVARAPMPVVVMPTMSATLGSETTVAKSNRPGVKAHNGTFNLVHVTNHTADQSKVKPGDGMKDLKEWLKKIDGIVSDEVDEIKGSASNKADDMEDSVLSKVTNLLNEVRDEDAASSF